ncbi:hypothetical protein GCM10020369_51760 [Cryptosporangium minutisporangium]|uniref:Secreted protein n=1 Tax=Cryptosporangium minutisporangium TaxID=113569 RepID=A0ABP6T3W7_9ACTN
MLGAGGWLSPFPGAAEMVVALPVPWCGRPDNHCVRYPECATTTPHFAGIRDNHPARRPESATTICGATRRPTQPSSRSLPLPRPFDDGAAREGGFEKTGRAAREVQSDW